MRSPGSMPIIRMRVSPKRRQDPRSRKGAQRSLAARPQPQWGRQQRLAIPISSRGPQAKTTTENTERGHRARSTASLRSADNQKTKSREVAKTEAKRGEQNVWREDGRDARKDDWAFPSLLSSLLRVFAALHLLWLIALFGCRPSAARPRWALSFLSVVVLRRHRKSCYEKQKLRDITERPRDGNSISFWYACTRLFTFHVFIPVVTHVPACRGSNHQSLRMSQSHDEDHHVDDKQHGHRSFQDQHPPIVLLCPQQLVELIDRFQLLIDCLMPVAEMKPRRKAPGTGGRGASRRRTW